MQLRLASGAWLIALLTAVQPLMAQAPTITSEGDPSVAADSIYALAVDPADHPDEDAVVLLDDGVIVIEPDGTGRQTFRTVAQILSRDAVEGWAELTLGFDGVREEFRLNWVRVIGADGRVISNQPAHQQVLDAPVAEQSPIFTDRKVMRISLAGVEPGVIVDFSYTGVKKQAVRPGDFFSKWLITPGSTIRRSRFMVDVPEGFDLRSHATPGTVAPTIASSGGRTVYTWMAADLESFEPEYFADYAARDDFQDLYVSAPGSWGDIGAWYADLARDRYELTPEVLAAAETVVAGATGEAALRALHRWVAQDFRYVSISLGLGGYQPRLPAEVWKSTSGDCKDKATLFIAVARHYGFEAYPVLLHTDGGIIEELPSIDQFNHAIAAVRHNGEWVFLDLTADILPFGHVAPGYQGEFGIVVYDDGRVEEVHFPEGSSDQNLTHTVLEGELFEDGRIEARYDERYAGASQYEARSIFANAFTDRELDDIGQQIASVIEGGRGKDLRVFDGLDLEAEPSVAVHISSSRATRPNTSGGQIFILPLDSYANPTLIAELEAELSTRTSPIAIDAVFGPMTTTDEVHLTLPEGWRAELPTDVVADSRFGRYEARYRQDGRRVSVVRSLSGRSGTAPKDALPELVEWLSEVSLDNTPFLLLEPGS